MIMPEPEFVKEFKGSFTKKDENCDVHGLTENTVIKLRDELLGDSTEAVYVRGEHPWEYRHFTKISKEKLEREKEKARRRYMSRNDYEEEKAKERSEKRYNIEELAKRIASTVFNDNKSTPQSMNKKDYKHKIKIKQSNGNYEIMLAWGPK